MCECRPRPRARPSTSCSLPSVYIAASRTNYMAVRPKRAAHVRPLLPPQDSPLGVHIFRHDLQTGVRVKGRDAIQLVAPRGETRWREALLAVQSKMSKAGCRRLLELPYDDPRVAAAVAATPRPLTSAAFAERPLAECTSAQRAKLLTSLCRRQPYVREAATPCPCPCLCPCPCMCVCVHVQPATPCIAR